MAREADAEDDASQDAMKTKRGNFLLAVGATSEIYMRRMLDIDIDYDGIANLNRPFLTTPINKTDLRDEWRTLLTTLTEFSRVFNPDLFHVHNMPGYEALTFALIDPNGKHLGSHVDAGNDSRAGYNRVANLSVVLQNGWRLSLIAYTRKLAGSFFERYEKHKQSQSV